MRRTAWLAFAALILAGAPGQGQEGQPMIGEDAPPFQLTDLEGGRVALSDLKGRFVVMHFAASW